MRQRGPSVAVHFDHPSMTQPRPILQLGLSAAKANALPALVLWMVGTCIVLSYYLWPAALPVFNRITALRDSLGLLYSVLSTALFAGLVPFLMQALQREGSNRNWSVSYLAFLMLLWAAKGIEIDLLYRLQAWLFGHGQSGATLAAKVLFDQLVYAPLWGLPTLILPMLYARSGFNYQKFKVHLRAGWFRRLILPVLLPNWFVWFPAATLIYLLPTALQLPMQNVVVCLWVLMVMFMTGQQSRTAQESSNL